MSADGTAQCPVCHGTGEVQGRMVGGRDRGWPVDKGWALYLEGNTLQEIGEAYGVTREAIRLGFVSEYGGSAVRAVRRQRNTAKRAEYEAERQAATEAATFPCFVCGAPARLRSSGLPQWVACFEHAPYRNELRRHIDPSRFEAHRNARSSLAHRAEPDAPPNRRFTLHGSAMDQLIQKAIANDWPLVGLLPEQIVYITRERMGKR